MSDVKGMSHVMASAFKALSLSIDKNVQFFMEVASMFHVGSLRSYFYYRTNLPKAAQNASMQTSFYVQGNGLNVIHQLLVLVNTSVYVVEVNRNSIFGVKFQHV